MRQLQAYESRSVGGIPPYNVSVNNQKQFNLSPARKNDDLLLLENQIADLNRFQSKLKSFEESKHMKGNKSMHDYDQNIITNIARPQIKKPIQKKAATVTSADQL